MPLTECRLGDYIELRENTNFDLKFGIEDVRGVNNLKQLMPTKADMNGRDISKFQIVCPGEFVFNHRTSRNGSKFSVAYNNGERPVICTEDYVVFRIRDSAKEHLLAEWLYMFFNRLEFDRYVITNSWGSSTEFFDWEDICFLELKLPSLPVQQKYVDICKAMVANQHSYERGLGDLKLACDAYIEDLRRKTTCEKIGLYLVESSQRNDFELSADMVRGLSTGKEMIPTKADMDGVELHNYKIVKPGQIAYVPDTSRRGNKISLGFNDTQDTFLVSSISCVFGTKAERLLPEYLMLFLTRQEFDRYARFCSWGSARETFEWSEMCNVKIPIPEIKLQRALAEIYAVYSERKQINERMKEQIKDICPVLIKGSLEEGAET